jgi:signal transduction histidine kinase
MRMSVRIVGHWVLRFAALTLLFALLNYMGSAIYHRAAGLTTLKPFGGVALALCLIYGRRWLWPIILSGTLGGIIAKYAFSNTLAECLLSPGLASVTLLATYLLSQQFVGRAVDFRSWRQLVSFSAIAACVSVVTGVLFSGQLDWGGSLRFWIDWQAWFIPTTLSYVIFTPVIVLLATAEKGVIRNNARAIAASLAMLAVVLACNFLPLGVPILFSIPLALLVMTMVSGVEGTAIGLVLTQLMLTAATLSGHGLAAIANLPLGSQLYFTQILITGLITVMLPAAAAVTERVTLRDGMQAALKREEQVNQALRESESRYREMAEQAQTANKAKSEFLASMSHELRTPLNAILGFSEILATELYGPLGHAKYVEYAEDVYKSGAHLLDLVNDVLDLSKIGAGKMELRETTFAVSELVDDAMLLVRGKARKHVRLETRVPQGIQLLADKRLTKQILINLLSNAIKFTPEGGTITVSAEETGDKGLEIAVVDTGVGMDAAQLEKAFSHYGQIDSHVSQAHQGTGLGLPIAQALARLQGGDLVAQSTPGKGTRMMLVLPQSRIVEAVKRARLSPSVAGSIQGFAETQDAGCEQEGTEPSQCQQIWPQDGKADTLQEAGPDYDQIIAQRIDVGEPLQNLRHACDRKAEARKREQGVDDEEVGGESLLLGGADGGDQEPKRQGAEQEERSAQQHHQWIAVKRHPKPQEPDCHNQRDFAQPD